MTAISAIVQACKVLVDAIDFGEDVTVRRTYLPRIANLATDLGNLTVFVFPASRDLSRNGPVATRNQDDELVGVQVAVLDKIDPDVRGGGAAFLDRCDAVEAHMELVIDALSWAKPAGHQWDSTTQDLVHSTDQLDEHGVFATYATFFYRGARARP